MVEVPTKDSVTDAGMTGVKAGGIGGIGQSLGRSVLGEGLGTAVGGVIAASAMSGSSRDRSAERAVERGIYQMLDSNSGGNTRQSRRGSM